MVRIAGLNEDGSFESEKVRNHVAEVAKASVDLSHLENKVSAVRGENTAVFQDSILTIDPSASVVNIPEISGSVTIVIKDVEASGTANPSGWTTSLIFPAVSESTVLTWPVGTEVNDKPHPVKHTALLMRSATNWHVYFPPTSPAGGMTELPSNVVVESDMFSEKYPQLYRQEYNFETQSMEPTEIIPIQEQISGSFGGFNENGEPVNVFGYVNGGYAKTIGQVVSEIYSSLFWMDEGLSRVGVRVTNSGEYEYPIAVPFHPDRNHILKVYAPMPKVIDDGTSAYMIYWVPVWATNTQKWLNGEDIPEADEIGYWPEKPQLQQEWVFDENTQQVVPIPVSPEDQAAYEAELDEWTKTWRRDAPIMWKSYRVELSRAADSDIVPPLPDGGY